MSTVADMSLAELDARVREQQGRSHGSVLTRQLQGEAVGLREDVSVAQDDIAALQAEGVHVVGAGGEPAFAGAWVNFDARVVCFWRAGDMVHLRGLAAGGVVGTAIFTLPVGYRPSVAGSVLHPVISNGALGGVVVDSAGVVTLLVGSNVYADLSPVHFRVA